MPTRPKDAATSRETADRLATTLRQLRFDRQLTQAQLADRLDISIEAYSRLERGQALPSFPTLLRICETLQTTPDALLLAKSPPSSPDGAREQPRVRTKPTNAGASNSNPLTIRKPALTDEPDEPAGVAPHGRVRLGASEQEHLDFTVELLRRLDRSDRVAVRAIVEQLALRAGLLSVARGE